MDGGKNCKFIQDFLIQSHSAGSVLLAKSAVWECLRAFSHIAQGRKKKTKQQQPHSIHKLHNRVVYHFYRMFSTLLGEVFDLILSALCESFMPSCFRWVFLRKIVWALSNTSVCVLCQNCFSSIALSCCRDLLLSFLSTVREAADSGRYPSFPLDSLPLWSYAREWDRESES